FIRREMAAADGRLLHSWRAGRAQHPASVDDYANLCRAALALHEASGDDSLVDQTEQWIAILDRHYRDPAGGGYFFSADDTPTLIARAKTAADAATPAGNGTLVGVMTRLAIMTGNDDYRRRAEAIVETFSGELGRNFFPLATLLNNAEFALKPVQIVLAGKPDDTALAELRRATYRVSLPNRVVAVVPPGTELPAGHPAHGKGLVGGKPAAYVCEGPVCSLPLTDSDTLTEYLKQLH
ncbi:MAG: thioredoxin domain-containing protein, partial [Alphaproteobacteria bacterium]|nr:thioredoxin domain-containing protein [Alphaproteobacteria bacterium]